MDIAKEEVIIYLYFVYNNTYCMVYNVLVWCFNGDYITLCILPVAVSNSKIWGGGEMHYRTHVSEVMH